VQDWGTLIESWWVTMSISLAALTAAVVLGVFLAVSFAGVEVGRALVLSLRGDPAGDADRGDRAADHHLGQRRQAVAADLRLDRRLLSDPVEHDGRMNSADQNLTDLFRLYRANWWQTLRYLKLPSAMPYSWPACASRAACR
jgi:NitT/TauT family transport system permease protein